MIHARIRTAAGEIHVDPAGEELHGLLEDTSNLIWLDLESPTVDELGLVAGILHWEHLTVEDLEHQGQRAKVEEFEGYAFLVMHSLAYEGTPPALTTPEIDFVIGPHYVASVHYGSLTHVTESREVRTHTEAMLARGTDYLLYTLVDRIVDSYFPVLDTMLDAVEDLEDHIVEDASSALLPRIFEMKRDGVSLRKVISPQLEVFTRLTAPAFGIVTDAHTIYFRDVHDHLIRVFDVADNYRELMSGALDAHLSTVSNRMNDVMKRLTVVAALFLPITFVTGLLGMNMPSQPLWTDPVFWLLLVGMSGLSLAQWLYFRGKGWT